MLDEPTIHIPRHNMGIIMYRPRGRGPNLPALNELRVQFDVRTIANLRDLPQMHDMYREAALLVTDPFHGREWALRMLRSRFPHTPVILYTDLEETFAPLLEEGLVDLVLPTRQPPALLRAAVVNMMERCAAVRHLAGQNADLGRRSVSDSLTQLYNHGHLIEALEREFRRAERQQEAVSCIMVDIDHFKTINDTHGHRFGDFVLWELGTLLRSAVRADDIVGRYGGEEFMLILPSTEGLGAALLAEKLRASIENHCFRSGSRQTIVTVSLGVASNADRGVRSAEHLLQMSDRALYYAKENGRNRVCAAHEHGNLDLLDMTGGGTLPDDSVPLVLMLTADAGLRGTVADLAENEQFQIVFFEAHDTFITELPALKPELAVIDCALTPYTEDLVLDLAVRSREMGLPLIAIADEQFFTGQAPLSDVVDDFVFENFRPVELGKKIETMLKLGRLQREHKRLGQDLRAAQRRMIRNERLRAIGEMTDGITHQFSNSFSASAGAAELLAAREDLTEDTRTLVESIVSACRDGVESVERLHAFLESDEGPETDRLLPMAGMVEECLQLTKSRWHDEAMRRGVAYRVANRVPSDLLIPGKASEMKEILVNLILNALDAMENGGTLTFEGDTVGARARLAVTDTGAGMTPDTLKRIYDPFFTTKHEKGSGLGMYLVHHIVSRAGGKVAVASQPDRGTTVTLLFPAGNAENLPPGQGLDGPPHAAASPPAGGDRRMRLLLIDDESMVREVHTRMLRALGHPVASAASGAEGIQMAREGGFDVVFTDLSMPDESGWATARQIHEILPHAAIVLVSGWGKQLDDALLAECGISHVLAKPVTMNQFRSLLANLRAPLPANRAMA
jgi:diguanylate cyclase (GGDEF)-like protein